MAYTNRASASISLRCDFSAGVSVLFSDFFDGRLVRSLDRSNEVIEFVVDVDLMDSAGEWFLSETVCACSRVDMVVAV